MRLPLGNMWRQERAGPGAIYRENEEEEKEPADKFNRKGQRW